MSNEKVQQHKIFVRIMEHTWVPPNT